MLGHNPQRDPEGFVDHREKLAAIALVRPASSDGRKLLVDRRQKGHGSKTVTDVGSRDMDALDQSQRVHAQMALATVDLLRAVIAVGPPFSVVFTEWLSMMQAVGSPLRPAATRTRARSTWFASSQIPARCQTRQ